MFKSIDDDGEEESKRAHRRDQALEFFNRSRDVDESCDGRSASGSQEPLERCHAPKSITGVMLEIRADLKFFQH